MVGGMETNDRDFVQNMGGFLQATLQETQSNLDESKAQALAVQNELQTVYASRSWRWAQKLARFARALGLSKPPSTTGLASVKPVEATARFLQEKSARLSVYPLLPGDIVTPCVPSRVSVVMPVYNGGEYLAAAIESVLNQTWRDLELILVDDGSTDHSLVHMEQYAKQDARVRIVRQTNQKLPRALNAGFALAQGEFLCWTSADNRMHPHCIERLHEALTASPKTALVYANMCLIDDNGDPLTDLQWYPKPNRPDIVLLPNETERLNTRPDNIIGAAFLYRASVAAAVGGYSPVRFTTEDYDYWMRINELFRVEHVPFETPIYDYRIHQDSLTAYSKEYSISKRTEQLVRWDTFRRWFLLQPAAWHIDAETSNEHVIKLRESIEHAGHMILTSSFCDFQDIPSCYIYVRFETDDPPPRNIQQNAYCVLVKSIPQTRPDGWDCCVTVERLHASELEDGWIMLNDIDTLFSFLDLRAKLCALAKWESFLYGEFE